MINRVFSHHDMPQWLLYKLSLSACLSYPLNILNVKPVVKIMYDYSIVSQCCLYALSS